MAKDLLQQRVFEARYEQGYRYLDRCGECMILLEQSLSKLTGALWMPQEASPKSAVIECPDLDMRLVIDATKLVLDQEPVGKMDEVDFKGIASDALAIITGRFGLNGYVRYGARYFWVIPSQDIEAAERASLKYSPFDDWRADATESPFRPRNFGVSARFEDEQHNGYLVQVRHFYKPGTEVRIDERLTMKPHLLPEGQSEALLNQIKRQRSEQSEPSSGVIIDVDYYRVRPNESVRTFIKESIKVSRAVKESIITHSQHRTD